MSLEEQLRRLGEARAAQAEPADRQRRGVGRTRWLVGAAAALVVAMAGAVWLYAGDDDGAVVQTADDTTDPSETPEAPVADDAPAAEESAPTVTTDPTALPTAGTISCAANPAPSDEILDLAVHVHQSRTPLDLDRDGVADEMLAYDDPEGRWWLLARLADGWTPALDIDWTASAADIGTPPSVPRLATTADGAASAHDLDGDGGLEFFVAGYADPIARLVSFRPADCALIKEFPDGRFAVTIGWPGYACEVDCFTRVSCADGVLVRELSAGSTPDRVWTRGAIRLVDGAVEVDELPLVPDDATGAPTEADTGFIDCRP